MPEDSQDNPPPTLDYRPAIEDRRAGRGRLAAWLTTIVFCMGYGGIALAIILFSDGLMLRLIGGSLILLLLAVGLFVLRYKDRSA